MSKKAEANLWPTDRPLAGRDRIECILGSEVASTVAKDEADAAAASPFWRVVLSYRYQFLKKATRSMLEDDRDPARAMQTARKSIELKERHFSMPTSVAAGQRQCAIGDAGRRPDGRVVRI